MEILYFFNQADIYLNNSFALKPVDWPDTVLVEVDCPDKHLN